MNKRKDLNCSNIITSITTTKITITFPVSHSWRQIPSSFGTLNKDKIGGIERGETWKLIFWTLRNEHEGLGRSRDPGVGSMRLGWSNEQRIEESESESERCRCRPDVIAPAPHPLRRIKDHSLMIGDHGRVDYWGRRSVKWQLWRTMIRKRGNGPELSVARQRDACCGGRAWLPRALIINDF